MAARENQGLQIALVIFVMLTIVSSAATFIFFRKFQEAESQEKAAVAKTADALKNQTVAQEEAIALKKVLGAGTRDTRQSIEDTAKQVMQAYAGNFKETDQHYQQLVKYLHAELAVADSLFVDAKRREEELKSRLTANDKVKVAEIAQFEVHLNKIAKDLTAERKAFNSDRKKFKDLMQEIVKAFDKDRRGMDEANKKLAEEIADQARQIAKLDIVKHELIGRLRDKEQYADMPRGKITGVDQRARIVWLNVGTADGLRRQVTFKVMAEDETNLSHGKKKGSVEVIRLVDHHLAEARITDDDLSDPIMPGDQLFSKVWIPGRVKHFALAGFMDIDGDHESDRKRVRDVIAMNGGILDAEVADDGQRSGEVTLDTHYLILGRPPTENTRAAGYLKAYSQLIRQADDLGVEKISLDRFLDNVGYQPELQTVSLAANPSLADFRAKPLGADIPRQSNPPFKPRRPVYSPAKPSAY